MTYQELYDHSIQSPEKFWSEQANAIKWFKKPTTILSKDQNEYPLWFADGELNACYLALDTKLVITCTILSSS